MDAQRLTPIASESVPWTAWSDVPRFGIRYRHLTMAAVGEDYRVGVAIEELPPGMQSAPAHYHIFEEEHLYVLEGSMTVRIGAQRFAVKPGDYVCFPAGRKAGHCLVNESSALCRYVIIGENDPNEVVHYTDSNKVLVRALGRRALFDGAALRNYWDGEETGLPAGQKPPADGHMDAPADEPKPPVSEADLPWFDQEGPEGFGGKGKHFTHAVMGEDYRVGVMIEAPAPGRRLAPRHYHMLEEEHALMLEGEATLLLGEERHPMWPGDYVCFPAGRKVGHSILNSGRGPCRTLMIGQRNLADVCVYPDSRKIAVGALRQRDCVFSTAQPLDYWAGEKAE
jgi:uncharacterized cupin superfamily protein